MSTPWAVLLSLVLLAANGFFVAAEFALVASKRYRLEQAAAGGSRAARAALDGSRELSLMLAGAQLGITGCSLGLGRSPNPRSNICSAHCCTLSVCLRRPVTSSRS
jgi:CBS domain containing-hemolysin-like protein